MPDSLFIFLKVFSLQNDQGYFYQNVFYSDGLIKFLN